MKGGQRLEPKWPARIKISMRPMAPYLLLDSDTSILLCLVVCAFGT